jgi:hypothetical protein
VSKKLSLLLSIALAFAAVSDVALAANQKPVKLSAPHPAAVQQTAPLKARTPLQKIFLPQIQKRIKGSTSLSKTSSAASAEASGISTTTPNFGGFLSAPYVPARLESSCIVDPYNCGVAAAVTADFNKDGKPDVAVIQFDGTLNVLLNNGSGSFAAIASYSNPNVSTTSVQQAFAVDLNNDGYPDILVFDASNNTLIAYLNLKNGTFASPVASNLSFDFGSIGSIAVGDVNGDGNLDVVTIASDFMLNSDVTVQTYLGAGNGTFQSATPALTQTVTIPAQVQFASNLAITLGDLNKDGKLDIAAELEEYTSQTTGQLVVTVSLGNGDGSFAALNVNNPISVPVTAQPGLPFLDISSAGVQIVDLNNDSNPDVAADSLDASGNDNLVVALGDGSGHFTSTVQTPNVSASQQIVYTDVTGDGIPDLIQTNGTLNIWTGKGDGTFSLPANGSTYTEDSGTAQSLALADFTGDGNVDIAQLGGDYKQLSIFAGNGKGSFYGAPTLSSTTDATPAPLYIDLQDVGDVQGKGFSSAIYVDYTGAIVTGVGDGKGNFTYITGLAASAVPKLAFIEPVQADLNGDGKQDILIAGTDGSLSVAFSNGDGTFQNPKSLGLPALDCSVSYAAASDLNGDGITDIALAYAGDAACGGSGSTASGYFVILGTGNGNFATPAFTAHGSELYSVTIADMNLDGKPDLILDDAPFQVSGTFGIDLVPGNGDGTFGQGSSISTNYLVSQVIAGDYNEDGKPDLILLSEGEATDQDFDTTAGVLLLPGNGDGTFGAATQLGTGNFFLNGSLTDVNNDGIPDLVLALYNTVGQPKTYYGLSTLLGEGGGAFSTPVNTLQSMASSLPLPGNFYSDNAPDFIVATGYGTSLYLGQGGSTIALSSSASSVTFDQSVTLTATLSTAMSNRPTPTGSVSFYDGSTLLQSVELSGGSASFSTSALTVGSHSFTAVYSGDANFNPNTSSASAVAVSALTPAFTLSATPTSDTVGRGQTAIATLNLSGNATFSGAINLTCSGAPANATCSVNPGSVTLASGGTGTATLILTTTTATSAVQYPSGPLSNPNSTASGVLSLAALVGLFTGWRTRKRLFMMLSLVVLSISGLGLTGCGGSSVNTASKGTYTITVTATPPSGMGTPQTATVSVTVN